MITIGYGYDDGLGAARRRKRRKRRGGDGELTVATTGNVTNVPAPGPSFSVERGGSVISTLPDLVAAVSAAKAASIGGEAVLKTGSSVLAIFKEGKRAFTPIEGLGCVGCGPRMGYAPDTSSPGRLMGLGAPAAIHATRATQLLQQAQLALQSAAGNAPGALNAYRLAILAAHEGQDGNSPGVSQAANLLAKGAAKAMAEAVGWHGQLGDSFAVQLPSGATTTPRKLYRSIERSPKAAKIIADLVSRVNQSFAASEAFQTLAQQPGLIAVP